MLLEEMLADLGCEVVGPYATLSAALDGARNEAFDVAVIDLNLAGEKADPIIAEIASREIPLAIASGGYDAASGHRPTALLDKPYSSAQLERAMLVLREALDAG
jgi:CheY-like chemotaxis protein